MSDRRDLATPAPIPASDPLWLQLLERVNTIEFCSFHAEADRMRADLFAWLRAELCKVDLLSLPKRKHRINCGHDGPKEETK